MEVYIYLQEANSALVVMDYTFWIWVWFFFSLQRLGDLAALAVFGQGLHIKKRDLPPVIKNILER